MSKRKKDSVWVAVLSIAAGLIIWHAVHWHSSGMYLEMFQWLRTGKVYITVLYNLGVMVVLGIVTGYLSVKIADLAGYRGDETKNLNNLNEERDRQ